MGATLAEPRTERLTQQDAVRRIGNQWLIEFHDLERHRELIRAGATSRAMSPRTAWAAGALLDGQHTR